MISSEPPHSYSDEYFRKKNLKKTLHTPTQLLTDRGAYLNYLEQQLERVSSACLTVHAYEDRLADIEALIKALEQRASANVKLIGLSQQCTEEVRAESEQRSHIIMKQVQEDKKSADKSFQMVSLQISQLEKFVEKCSKLESRIEWLETTLSENDTKHKAREEELLKHIVDLQKTTLALNDNQQNAQGLIEKLQTTTNKLSYDVDDQGTRLVTYYQDLEKKLQEQITQVKLHHEQDLREVERNFHSQFTTIQLHFDTKCKDIVDTIQRNALFLTNELDEYKKQVNENMSTFQSNQQTETAHKLIQLQQQSEHQYLACKEQIDTFCQDHDVQFQDFTSYQERKVDNLFQSIVQHMEYLDTNVATAQEIIAQQCTQIRKQVEDVQLQCEGMKGKVDHVIVDLLQCNVALPMTFGYHANVTDTANTEMHMANQENMSYINGNNMHMMNNTNSSAQSMTACAGSQLDDLTSMGMQYNQTANSASSFQPPPPPYSNKRVVEDHILVSDQYIPMQSLQIGTASNAQQASINTAPNDTSPANAIPMRRPSNLLTPKNVQITSNPTTISHVANSRPSTPLNMTTSRPGTPSFASSAPSSPTCGSGQQQQPAQYEGTLSQSAKATTPKGTKLSQKINQMTSNSTKTATNRIEQAVKTAQTVVMNSTSHAPIPIPSPLVIPTNTSQDCLDGEHQTTYWQATTSSNSLANTSESSQSATPTSILQRVRSQSPRFLSISPAAAASGAMNLPSGGGPSGVCVVPQVLLQSLEHYSQQIGEYIEAQQQQQLDETKQIEKLLNGLKQDRKQIFKRLNELGHNTSEKATSSRASTPTSALSSSSGKWQRWKSPTVASLANTHPSIVPSNTKKVNTSAASSPRRNATISNTGNTEDESMVGKVMMDNNTMDQHPVYRSRQSGSGGALYGVWRPNNTYSNPNTSLDTAPSPTPLTTHHTTIPARGYGNHPMRVQFVSTATNTSSAASVSSGSGNSNRLGRGRSTAVTTQTTDSLVASSNMRSVGTSISHHSSSSNSNSNSSGKMMSGIDWVKSSCSNSGNHSGRMGTGIEAGGLGGGDTATVISAVTSTTLGTQS